MPVNTEDELHVQKWSPLDLLLKKEKKGKKKIYYKMDIMPSTLQTFTLRYLLNTCYMLEATVLGNQKWKNSLNKSMST